MFKRNIIVEAIEKIGIKKAITVSVVTLCVLFPTVLAIFNIIYTNNTIIVSTSDSSSIVLSDSEGNELFREDAVTHDDEQESLIDIFRSICTNMKKSDTISTDTVTAPPLTAALDLDGTKTTLICYFSFTEGSSYLIDSEGQYYTIATADSERFLCSRFSKSLYSEAAPPTLTTIDGEQILPQGGNWSYRNIASELLPWELTLSDNQKVIGITGGLSLSFSSKPDICNVSVKQFEEKIFEGSFDELQYVTIDSGSILNISIRAEWKGDDSTGCQGKLSYDFKVIIRKRAELSIDKELLSPREFAIVKVTNVTDTSRLLFTSEDSQFTPEFYLSGETAYALIPYPHDVDGSKYDFTVSYGVATKTFTLSLENTLVPSRDQIAASSTAFGVNFKQSTLTRNDHIFLTGAYTAPQKGGYSPLSGFGDVCEYADTEYNMIYTQFECSDGYGMPVLACYGGSVIYVGENSVLGKYAIIDIGLGIKLWYCNLGSVDVKAGGYVASGQVVGKSGHLTFADAEGFGLMVSIYDTPISADFVLGKNFDIE